MTLSDFREKYLGRQVEYHSYGSGAYNQCVDLVNMYVHECLDGNTKDYTEIIGTNAKDFKDKFDPEDFDFISNTTSPNVMPERGDVCIWNGRVGGGVGHVAVVLEADGMSFKSLDQNWSEVERVTEENHSYTNVSGWLRPKMSVYIEELEERLKTTLNHEKFWFDALKLLGLPSNSKWKTYRKEISDLNMQIENLQIRVDKMETGIVQNVTPLDTQKDGKYVFTILDLIEEILQRLRR